MLSLRGNPKYCVYTEPLWGIPYHLYIPFVSIYMSALMMTDRQIGIVTSVTMFFRAIMAFFSGAITDKMGRKRTTLIFDILSWSVPCLLWAFSQNFWWFMVAAAFNGMWQVTENSWTCLLVEDAKKSDMVDIYSLIHMSGQLVVIFAPLSGLMVKGLTVIPAMRILYLFSFLSMTAKFIILYRYCGETEVGKVRMKETEGTSIMKIMSGYGAIFKRMFSSADMLLALSISTIFTITSMILQNYFGLLTTQNLMVPQEYLAYFPILRSLIITFFIFGIQNRLTRFGYKGPMLVGILFYVASHIMLLFAPVGGLAMPVLHVVLEACANGLVMPRKDSIVALLIEPKERARISSIMTVIVLAINIPFGYLTGWLSDLDRRLPFLLGIVIFALSFVVIARSKRLSGNEMTEMEVAI